MTTKLVDTEMGVSPQAMALGLMLSRYTREDFPSLFGVGSHDLDVRTFAWYNGRERGRAVTVRPVSFADSSFVVCFYEHRVSDALVVSSFETEEEVFNGPLAAYMPEGAYKLSASFEPWRVYEAGQEVLKRINGFCDKIRPVLKEGKR